MPWKRSWWKYATPSTAMAPDPEPFAGLPLDEPLVDEETWEKARRALVSAGQDVDAPGDDQ